MPTAPLPDIRRPDRIDAAWLTSALQAAGVDAVVRAFQAKPIGTGQIGDSLRFQLTYERGGDDAPASLVGKFPSADPDSFAAGVSGRNYVREVMFYRRLADTALIATPRCYLADVDEVTSEFVLLMEDLAPAEQGDQLRGVSVDEALLVVDEAAKLHASHWGAPGVETEPWLLASRASDYRPPPPEVIKGMWGRFVERYADRLEPKVMQAGAKLAERIEVFRTLNKGARCLTHNDFRPDNMMFATAAGGRPITVLDWQSVGLGCGPSDLAYFLAGALPPETRRAHEAQFLARYHQGLTSCGVSGYDAAALRRDYGWGAFRLLMTAFMSSVRVKRTARGDDMFMQMAHSAAEHIFDHGALALLDEPATAK
jgi:hypothetical protein